MTGECRHPSRSTWTTPVDAARSPAGTAWWPPTGDLQLRRPVLRLDRGHEPERPDCGHGRRPGDRPGGYWLVASDGGIFTFGDAGF
jgi:hypothetical protein